MDPYIEGPELWSDFHNNLASEIQARLNRHIQPRYFARLTPYVTYEVIEVAQVRGVRQTSACGRLNRRRIHRRQVSRPLPRRR
jgi:hypothetical protein